jgi:phage protein D
MSTPDTVPGTLIAVLPSVFVGSAGTTTAEREMPEELADRVERIVVDSHLHLPDMFEITFMDNKGDALSTGGISVGVPVDIYAGPADSGTATLLMAGEVTSVEGVFAGSLARTVVRGYSRDHRLQRARRNRTFANMKDSDIAKQIATEAGIPIGTVEETRTTHEHMPQVNQTDWEFLCWRAGDTGFEFGVAEGKFYFRKASGVSSGGSAVDLAFPIPLRAFRPRVTAGNLSPETEVRVWDPLAAKVISAKASADSDSVGLDDADAGRLAGMFAPTRPAQPAAGNPALGDLGPAPSDTAFVMSSRPLASGSAITAAAEEAVAGLAQQVAGTFAEAEGEAVGDPRLTGGCVATVSGVSDPFNGDWVVTSARHVFDAGRYLTHFEVSGRRERTLLALASGGTPRGRAPRIDGLVCGIVSNINDPQKAARVKVTLPWLSPQFESDWASVVQVGAGQRTGAMFLPQVGDEVLAGFEFGDPRRPYVLGGIVTAKSAYQLGGEPLKVQGETASVAWRGFVSEAGNRLAFHDEVPPGEGAPPTASQMVLGTSDGAMAVAIDQVAGTVAISCKPAPPNSKTQAGELTIACGDTGTININAGMGGKVNVTGTELSLSAQASLKIESQGPVEIKGNPIKLN